MGIATIEAWSENETLLSKLVAIPEEQFRLLLGFVDELEMNKFVNLELRWNQDKWEYERMDPRNKILVYLKCLKWVSRTSHALNIKKLIDVFYENQELKWKLASLPAQIKEQYFPEIGNVLWWGGNQDQKDT